jgi:hypothetical protein
MAKLLKLPASVSGNNTRPQPCGRSDEQAIMEVAEFVLRGYNPEEDPKLDAAWKHATGGCEGCYVLLVEAQHSLAPTLRLEGISIEG